MTLDAKNRIAVPSRYRERLREQCDGQLIVTVDPMEGDPCLFIYPLPTWEELEQELTALPTLNRYARNLQRLVMGYATDVELDAQGRVRLSQELREFAGLERNVMLIGQGHKFELWDADLWIDRRDSWRAQETAQTALPPELASLRL